MILHNMDRCVCIILSTSSPVLSNLVITQRMYLATLLMKLDNQVNSVESYDILLHLFPSWKTEVQHMKEKRLIEITPDVCLRYETRKWKHKNLQPSPGFYTASVKCIWNPLGWMSKT